MSREKNYKIIGKPNKSKYKLKKRCRRCNNFFVYNPKQKWLCDRCGGNGNEKEMDDLCKSVNSRSKC